jgi:hypothetical protein
LKARKDALLAKHLGNGLNERDFGNHEIDFALRDS